MATYTYLYAEFDDKGRGTSVSNEGGIVSAGGGDDTIEGGRSADIIRGGSGDDRISGGGGDDALFGDTGDDVISGGEGDDDIAGGSGDDILTGGAGRDHFIFLESLGPTGTDTITDFSLDEDFIDLSTLGGSISFDDLTIADSRDDYGNPGASVSHNAFGTIFLSGVHADELTEDQFILPRSSSFSAVESAGGLGVLTATGSEVEGTGEDDFIIGADGDETIRAGANNDIVLGGEGNDRIAGGKGIDILMGGEGNDSLYGGAGTDYLFGGAGNDRFFYKGGDGNDVIFTFSEGDKIYIDTAGHEGVADFSDLKIDNHVAGAVIDLSSQGGGKIQLAGVDASEVDAGDFAFYDSTSEADGF